ncbi:hypothetical protein B296_00040048 [Ensete ventricosum]|uniref:Leucine-rich repeat-containing N-terminal plant-type domain-containing protein n=1 Tax=Ensete ventricosum TaxID=4639 RepID=A0A426YGD7_ENSVE|nr:hypothetical protein B296_00040048 [Ensete ventricosum]
MTSDKAGPGSQLSFYVTSLRLTRSRTFILVGHIFQSPTVFLPAGLGNPCTSGWKQLRCVDRCGSPRVYPRRVGERSNGGKHFARSFWHERSDLGFSLAAVSGGRCVLSGVRLSFERHKAASKRAVAMAVRWRGLVSLVLLGSLSCVCGDTSEGATLVEIKKSFRNVDNVLYDWTDNPSSDHCSWRGVICDNVTFSVVAL